MSNEEFEKQREFILGQQAQFAADIGELKDIVRQLSGAALSRFEATEKRLDDVDEKLSALVDSQMKTEENMRSLIAVVDRYFSEGRNGKS
jgi:KaiC/GvpD/RAD55 family RecA-like ATPase